jgi:thioredoxin reductase (NADPH)
MIDTFGHEPTLNGQLNKIRLYGHMNSPEAYALRDFLHRSVVAFDWIVLTSDADSYRELGSPLVEPSQLPVVVFPSGERLFAPTIRDVAERLGWIDQPNLKEYDLSIYGAGPAGLSAAVYAASEGLRTVLVERQAIGGQAGTSSLIENYLGFPHGISGAKLAERARQQAIKFGIDILLMREGVKSVFRNNRIYTAMADGSTMSATANICATGIEYRRLGLPNEDRLLNRGVFYGAGASEAPLCRNEHVFVVGGDNSAGQAALHFARYAHKVTMIIRGADLSASLSHYLVRRIRESNNIAVLVHSEVTGLDGDATLQHIEISNRRTGTTWVVEAQRLFICIGGVPNTEWAKDTYIIRDPAGYLITGPDLLQNGQPPACWTLARSPFFLETSVPGSFAAGDVRHNSVKRVASAVGEGAMAVSFVHTYLEEIANV